MLRVDKRTEQQIASVLYVLPTFFAVLRRFLGVYEKFEQCVIECLRVFKLHSVRRGRNFGLAA